MKKNIIAICITLYSIVCWGQTQTQAQLNYCKKEVEELEKEVIKYKNLLEIQNNDLVSIKLKVVELNRQVKLLEHEKSEGNKISVELLDLAIKYEERGSYREAMDIYRLLIKNFPVSLEAASSKIKVVDLKEKQAGKKK